MKLTHKTNQTRAEDTGVGPHEFDPENGRQTRQDPRTQECDRMNFIHKTNQATTLDTGVGPHVFDRENNPDKKPGHRSGAA